MSPKNQIKQGNKSGICCEGLYNFRFVIWPFSCQTLSHDKVLDLNKFKELSDAIVDVTKLIGFN